ncbi:MAG: AAA family ATPase [Bacteroidia bacterium]
MGIEHRSFDPERSRFPVSASAIRADLLGNWSFLPDAVKAYYQKTVVLLGTECTGKSSLSEALAREFDASLVPEVGRELIPDSNDFDMEVLKHVAEKHAENIRKAEADLRPLVFIDTNVFITLSYCRFRFGKFLALKKQIYLANQPDFAFYLDKDLPFEQDGTRLNEHERNALDKSHRWTLMAFGQEFIEVGGSWQDRFDTIMHQLLAIMKNG